MEIEQVPFGWTEVEVWLGTKSWLWGKRTWPILADLGAFRQPGQSRPAFVKVRANRAELNLNDIDMDREPESYSVFRTVSCPVLNALDPSCPSVLSQEKNIRACWCSAMSEFMPPNARHNFLPILRTA